MRGTEGIVGVWSEENVIKLLSKTDMICKVMDVSIVVVKSVAGFFEELELLKMKRISANFDRKNIDNLY